jgi:formate hydrogenlyase subunit 3/multisubunit Na+/H+ antiporter MnhD subunit
MIGPADRDPAGAAHACHTSANTNTMKVYEAPDFGRPGELWLQKEKTLRRLIGTLGMLLPLLLPLFLYFDNGHQQVLPSISHYYFTRANPIFIIIVSILGVFLIIYKGHTMNDFIVSTLSGLGALLLLIFPTDNLAEICNLDHKNHVVTVLKISPARASFHYACAAVFLGGLAFMSLFFFTRSNKPKGMMGRAKEKRNIIYRVCGIVMVMAMLIIVAGLLGMIDEETDERLSLTFWMETLAVEAFGISWLVKGETLYRDRDEDLIAA